MIRFEHVGKELSREQRFKVTFLSRGGADGVSDRPLRGKSTLLKLSVGLSDFNRQNLQRA